MRDQTIMIVQQGNHDNVLQPLLILSSCEYINNDIPNDRNFYFGHYYNEKEIYLMENTIAAILGAIVGGIIGIFSTLYATRSARATSLDIIKITEFNKAAATFSVAFVDVIFTLRQNTEGKREVMTSKIITDEVLIIQEKAKILFEPFLAISDTRNFNDAWDKYVNCPYNYQKDYTTPDPQIKEESQYCLQHVEALLFYAKPK